MKNVDHTHTPSGVGAFRSYEGFDFNFVNNS